MISLKKEEAKAKIEAVDIATLSNKINVLDIKVEDNFDVDDI
jgi:hypothetical protein